MKTNHYLFQIKTVKGTFTLDVTDAGLYELHFPGKKKKRYSTARPSPKAAAIARQTEKALARYFSGKPEAFRALPLDLGGLTDFQTRILKLLRRINWGSHVSYGMLARRGGSPGAARAVGSVMRKNRLPIIVPCHRVRSAGGLGGYSQGLHWKKSLLGLENAGI